MTDGALIEEAGFFISSGSSLPVQRVEPSSSFFRFSFAPPKGIQILSNNFHLHKRMLESSTDEIESARPICFVLLPGDASDKRSNSSASSSVPALAAEYYGRIEEQLKGLSDAADEDQEVERGAVNSAITVISELKRRQMAPPAISWHGGDAVVMLWALGDTTYAITVTDGELGYVVRRSRKTIKLADSIALDQFKLEDLR